jgi:hypothetical protein
MVGLMFCGAVFAGIRSGVPPFSSLLAFNEEIKERWDNPADRAPIPHAELLSLRELAQQAEVDLSTALSRLAAAGITNASGELRVGKIAEYSHMSGQHVYQIMLGSPASRGGGGSSDGFLGGGAGGGPGRKTLAQYCAEQNLAVADALARLEARGIEANETVTLREITVNSHYDKPYQILEIIHAR